MLKKRSEPFSIKVGARSSTLSCRQVAEVLSELHLYHPHIDFEPIYLSTPGDRDHHTSLRQMDKTDFFTRDIDSLLLKGAIRVGIHSAKDLPDPLPQGLQCVALTRGLDPSDVLVVRDEHQVTVVATSSVRREQQVAQLYPQARFVDIRGTIEERLAKLYPTSLGIDGVVIAEAALIRLGLTHYKRIRLPGQSAPLQGKLAVIARKEDQQMQELFQCLSYMSD